MEYWPEESTEGQEAFELVVFSSYEVKEMAPYLGERRAWIGDATWKPLERTSVEVLVGRYEQTESVKWESGSVEWW